MKKKLKKLAVVLTAAVVLCMPVMTAFAATATDTGTDGMTANIPFVGTIQAASINIYHPVSVAYTIDPNSNSIISPDITIKNLDACAIQVKAISLATASGGQIQFTDVGPGDKDWANLNAADSKKYIALGIGASGTGWRGSTNQGYAAPHYYAVDTGTKDMVFGFIDGTLSNNVTSATLTLDGKFGRAFDQAYTCVHNLVLEFDLV